MLNPQVILGNVKFWSMFLVSIGILALQLFTIGFLTKWAFKLGAKKDISVGQGLWVYAIQQFLTILAIFIMLFVLSLLGVITL